MFRSGERIALVRLFKGLTQEELAGIVQEVLWEMAEMMGEKTIGYGVHSIRTRLGEWETGIRLPTDLLAITTAKVLDIDLYTLLRDIENESVRYSEIKIRQRYNKLRSRVYSSDKAGSEIFIHREATSLLNRIHFPYLSPILSTDFNKAQLEHRLKVLIKRGKQQIVMVPEGVLLSGKLIRLLDKFLGEIEEEKIIFPLRMEHRDARDYIEDKRREYRIFRLEWISKTQEESVLRILNKSQNVYKRNASIQSQVFIEYFIRGIEELNSLKKLNREYTDKIKKVIDRCWYRNFVSAYALKRYLVEVFSNSVGNLVNSCFEYSYLHGGGVGNKAHFYSFSINPVIKSCYDIG